MEFSEPGPPWVMTTPNFFRSLTRLNPSAAMIAPRSCRNMMVRMPSLATNSMSWLEGKHETHSTPSIFRTAATVSSTFMTFLLQGPKTLPEGARPRRVPVIGRVCDRLRRGLPLAKSRAVQHRRIDAGQGPAAAQHQCDLPSYPTPGPYLEPGWMPMPRGQSV